jgi:hypothetical protein
MGSGWEVLEKAPYDDDDDDDNAVFGEDLGAYCRVKTAMLQHRLTQVFCE